MAKKLLLIEDSLSIQALVASAFEPEDFDLIVADNATDGLHKAQTLEPDIVLADASMPDMDGFQLCQRIRQTPAGRHVPVVLLTSGFAAYDTARGHLAGVTTHLLKPFASHALVDLVRQCLPNVPRRMPSPPRPAASDQPMVPATAHSTEPGVDIALEAQLPHTLPIAPQQWADPALEPSHAAAAPSAVWRESMAGTSETRTTPPPSTAGATDRQEAKPPAFLHTLPSPPLSSTTPDDTALAFYRLLGCRFEQMLRETLEAQLRSAVDQLMPQMLATAHAVIAEKMPDMLAGLLQQEIDQLKRAAAQESEHGAPQG